MTRVSEARFLSVRMWIGLVLGCSVLLGATGAWLTLRYRPQPTLSIFPGASAQQDLLAARMHDVHVVVALAFAVALAGLVVALAVRIASWRQAGLLAVATATAVVAAVAAYGSGGDLRWSSLALRAVSVNVRFEGVWEAAFGDAVRFVLTNREVTQADYRVTVVAHLFAIPVLVAASVALAWASQSRWRRNRSGPSRKSRHSTTASTSS